MSDASSPRTDLSPNRRYIPGAAGGSQPSSLADVLDRVLDKGLVIAGDISISLAQVELITIKIRLLLASADKAKEMGIDWWTRDPALTGGSASDGRDLEELDKDELIEQARALQQEVQTLESRMRGLLSRHESTATAPTAISAADLLAQQSGAGPRGSAGGVTSQRAQEEERDTGGGQDEEEDSQEDGEE